MLLIPYFSSMIHASIEQILLQYKDTIGQDFEVYRNHVYRVFSYATEIDSSPHNKEKYAIAAAFHDLGIWTHSFDYIAPSVSLCSSYLAEHGHSEWEAEISLIIQYHHKMSSYKGEYATTVEVFRQADWADVSMGLLISSISKSYFTAIQKQFSTYVYHIRQC